MQDTYAQIKEGYQRKHVSFYREPSSAYIEPFRIFGPLYYVGDRQVCVHLLATSHGLLLIDSGFPHTIHMLTDSIFRLGFDPRDVRWILHTHGHFDHFGASNEFRSLYGCQLAISRVDAGLLREKPEAALLDWCDVCTPAAKIPEFQIELEDGEDLVLGDLTVHCVLIPGHTPGAMAFFLDLREGEETCRAGLFGGGGLGSLRRPVLARLGLPESLREDMLSSLEKVRGQHVDIMLGNHPGNNDTLGRRRRQLEQGGNHFVDPSAWGRFLDTSRDRFLAMYEQQEGHV